MSLEKKSIHIRIHPDQQRQLSVIAELADKDMVEIATVLLEKAIAGEWLQAQRGIDRMRSLGIIREYKGE